jgi:integration host factor subunit beta
MATITKRELIDRIAEREGYKRVLVKRVVQSFLDSIIQELSSGNRLEFRDFGVFESRMRASRDAQNPKTMNKVHVPSKRTVKFKIGRVLKLRLHATPPAVDGATGLIVEASAPQTRKSASIGDGAMPRR